MNVISGDWLDLGVSAVRQSSKKTAKVTNRNKVTKTNCECESATYKSCTVLEYTKKCRTEPWRGFFNERTVLETISKISSKLATISNKEDTHIEPPLICMFEALKRVSPNDIKVVILGQDPTPQSGKATGLAFSLNDNPRKVPAVLNVLLEVALEGWKVDLRFGDLTTWAKQGVLLLNTALTIARRGKKAVSHLSVWRPFTKLLIKYISDKAKPSAWMLWGEKAQSFKGSDQVPGGVLIDPKKHKILSGQHPSPRGVTASGFNGFFARGYFKCANEFLIAKKRNPEINWGLSKETYLEPCP